jgi:hypothetical protein
MQCRRLFRGRWWRWSNSWARCSTTQNQQTGWYHEPYHSLPLIWIGLSPSDEVCEVRVRASLHGRIINSSSATVGYDVLMCEHDGHSCVLLTHLQWAAANRMLKLSACIRFRRPADAKMSVFVHVFICVWGCLQRPDAFPRQYELRCLKTTR